MIAITKVNTITLAFLFSLRKSEGKRLKGQLSQKFTCVGGCAEGIRSEAFGAIEKPGCVEQ